LRWAGFAWRPRHEPAIDRAEGTLRGNKLDRLTAWLDVHRDALSHKCSGLSEEQLETAAVDQSPLTLEEGVNLDTRAHPAPILVPRTCQIYAC
jgi:hypothetical protein